MAKVTRMYEITVKVPNSQFEKIHLVDASSQSAAEKHVGKQYVSKAKLANGKRVAQLMEGGTKMETASDADGE